MIAEAPCKDFVLRLPLRDAIRRDGRVVDYSSLENCRTEMKRSLEFTPKSLRAVKRGKRVVIRKISTTNRLCERFIGASFVDQFLCLVYLLSII